MGSSSQNVKQETVPWGPQAEQLRKFYSEAGALYEGGQQRFFPGATVAAQSGDTVLAFDLARELATGFQPRNEANKFVGSVLSGDFMPGAGSNPYLDDTFDVLSNRVSEAYRSTVLPSIQSRFAGAGHVDSSALGGSLDRSERTLARELGDVGTQLYYGDYERRMGDRFRAAGLSSQLQQDEASAIGLLSSSGAQQSGFEQALIDEAIQRFQFAQNEPEDRLNRFGSRVGQNLGFGTTTGTQPSGGANAGLSAGLGVLSMLGQIIAAGVV